MSLPPSPYRHTEPPGVILLSRRTRTYSLLQLTAHSSGGQHPHDESIRPLFTTLQYKFVSHQPCRALSVSHSSCKYRYALFMPHSPYAVHSILYACCTLSVLSTSFHCLPRSPDLMLQMRYPPLCSADARCFVTVLRPVFFGHTAK